MATLDLSVEDARWLRAAAYLDAAAWHEEFGIEHDRTGLLAESNVFRYRRLLQPLEVRIGEGRALRDVLRLKLAALITGSPVRFSASSATATTLRQTGVEVAVVEDDAFARFIEEHSSTRVCALGLVDGALRLAAAQSGSVVLDSPVLADGRRELLSFLLEQTVSATRHRFGVISPELAPNSA